MRKNIIVNSSITNESRCVKMERAYIIHTKDHLLTESELRDTVKAVRGQKHYPYIIEFFTNRGKTTVINHETEEYYN